MHGSDRCIENYGYQEKDRKLFAPFMDFEKASSRINRMSFWDVLGMCGVGRHLLEGIRFFCWDASPSRHMKEVLRVLVLRWV